MSTESVPAYFADFKEENARQHGKWVVATMLGGITAVSGLMFTLAYLMQSA